MLGFILALGLTIQPAWAAYPEKAIEMIIHMGPGSAPDIEGRVFGTEMSKVLGKPVVPINKEGGGGAVAYTHVKNAKPDGYTIAWNSLSIRLHEHRECSSDYDALEHIGQIMTQPMWSTVKGDAKWKTVQDFVADAKKNLGSLRSPAPVQEVRPICRPWPWINSPGSKSSMSLWERHGRRRLLWLEKWMPLSRYRPRSSI
jgi:tripartite-type tricarboxylate transporter receptor subunit TctC